MAAQDGGMGARLDLQLRQKLVMTPQLQQAIRLLQLSRMELAQEMQTQIEENPLMEEVGSESQEEEGPLSQTEEGPVDAEGAAEGGEEAKEDIDLKWDNYYDDEERERIESDVTWEAPEEKPSFETTLTRALSLNDYLLGQLGLAALSDPEKEIGRDIIGNINDHGYLEASIEEIRHDMGGSVASEDIEGVLGVIQGFDPPGVGAHNLIECLLIQIRVQGVSDPLVTTLIQRYLGDLEKRRYALIAKACNTSIDAVMHAAKIIERLEPKPGRPFYANENFNIVPDVFVVKVEDKEAVPEDDALAPITFSPFQSSFEEGAKEEGENPERYTVVLNDDGLPKVKISPYYQALLKSPQSGSESPRAYLEEKYKSAIWFIKSIEQRNKTILKVAESILKFQYAFMKKGVSGLKPLVLKQVAEDIEMHESTVSRVTTNKYIQTPQGTFELKFFFNGSLASSGNETDTLHSSVAVREKIEQMVSHEEPTRPLTDQKIVERLKREGVEIARRTVSKYRAELKIAPASRRRRPG